MKTSRTMSGKFVEALDSTGNVEVEKLPRDAAMDRVRRGQLVGMIAIPKGFGETAGMMWMERPAIEVGVDPSRKAEAGMLQGMIMQAMGKLMIVAISGSGEHAADASKRRKKRSPTRQTCRSRCGRCVAQMMDSLDTFAANVGGRAGGRSERQSDERRIGRDARVSTGPHRNDRRHAQRFPKAAPKRCFGSCGRSGTSAFRRR